MGELLRAIRDVIALMTPEQRPEKVVKKLPIAAQLRHANLARAMAELDELAKLNDDTALASALGQYLAKHWRQTKNSILGYRAPSNRDDTVTRAHARLALELFSVLPLDGRPPNPLVLLCPDSAEGENNPQTVEEICEFFASGSDPTDPSITPQLLDDYRVKIAFPGIKKAVAVLAGLPATKTRPALAGLTADEIKTLIMDMERPHGLEALREVLTPPTKHDMDALRNWQKLLSAMTADGIKMLLGDLHLQLLLSDQVTTYMDRFVEMVRQIGEPSKLELIFAAVRSMQIAADPTSRKSLLYHFAQNGNRHTLRAFLSSLMGPHAMLHTVSGGKNCLHVCSDPQCIEMILDELPSHDQYSLVIAKDSNGNAPLDNALREWDNRAKATAMLVKLDLPEVWLLGKNRGLIELYKSLPHDCCQRLRRGPARALWLTVDFCNQWQSLFSQAVCSLFGKSSSCSNRVSLALKLATLLLPQNCLSLADFLEQARQHILKASVDCDPTLAALQNALKGGTVDPSPLPSPPQY